LSAEIPLDKELPPFYAESICCFGNAAAQLTAKMHIVMRLNYQESKGATGGCVKVTLDLDKLLAEGKISQKNAC
jgi:hypothetical protein